MTFQPEYRFQSKAGAAGNSLLRWPLPLPCPPHPPPDNIYYVVRRGRGILFASPPPAQHACCAGGHHAQKGNFMETLLNRWTRLATEDPAIAAELQTLNASPGTPAPGFTGELHFGTGGLRGILGAGPNRMNIYTVRRATQGLAAYILAGGGPKAAAIAHDSRQQSDVFAREAARVLAANGITAHLFPRLMPTPALSFAVRRLGCAAGICVTASHNPAEYNGYKVYGADGCQLTTGAAQAVQTKTAGVDPFDGVRTAGFDSAVQDGSIRFIGEDVVDAYLKAVLAQRLHKQKNSHLNVVYTPLNGAGLECVSRVLQKSGTAFSVVAEQENPDGCFPTCPYPNPEMPKAMELGLHLAKQSGANLMLATDPDCDRLGVGVPKRGGGFRLLTGNEVGVLLLDYICKKRLESGRMPKHPVAVKTIVTTDMAEQVAAKYGVELREVLTGFKFIGEQVGLLADAGEERRFLFGFEESNGYLPGAYVRDKDGVAAALLVCDMAEEYLRAGKTLADAMDALYREHGYYQTALLSYAFEGPACMAQMQGIMEHFRKNGLPGADVAAHYDYLSQTGSGPDIAFRRALPPADVLDFTLQNGARLLVRPSGTEPKLKLYLTARGANGRAAKSALAALKQTAEAALEAAQHGKADNQAAGQTGQTAQNHNAAKAPPKRAAVIMAGGRGERFWPRSRQTMPKQFLSLTGGGKTLFQLTVERMRTVTDVRDIYVVTNEQYCEIAAAQAPELPRENILCEPQPKNTAPAIALAAAVIQKRMGDAVMYVVPSDHLIQNMELFSVVMQLAADFAGKGSRLVTLGVTPTRADTGYGYIKLGKSAPDVLRGSVFRVERFVEKPNAATAAFYLKNGGYLWNSGIFIWKTSTLLKGLEQHAPAVFRMAQTVKAAVDTSEFDDVVAQSFREVPSISVDYALMEPARNIYTVPVGFPWSDVGSWDAIGAINTTDENGNVHIGNTLSAGSENVVLISEGRLITAVGVENIVVVETPDSVLVCNKDCAQDVKDIVNMLKERNMTEYL